MDNKITVKLTKSIVDKINPVSNDVTAGYIMRDVERQRKPMQRITEYLIMQTAGSLEVLDEVVLGNSGFNRCSQFASGKHLKTHSES